MFTCLVCGYNKLEEIPYDKCGNASYEICPCCGFEFGFDDYSEGNSFHEYRNQWIESGAEWFHKSSKPKKWAIKDQLKNIDIFKDLQSKKD